MASGCKQCGKTLKKPVSDGLCGECRDKATGYAQDSSLAMSGQEPKPSGVTAGRPSVRYIGDYELLEEIGRGGMGVVYKARQVSLNRTVALKMILAGQFARESEIKRFRTEAEAAANLQHPGIVTIYEVGEHEGHQYYSMDHVEGESLAALIRRQNLPLRQAVDLAIQVARAVHYAHQRGIIHRDLKPSNILLDSQGTPKVVDFGLAKQVDGSQEVTLSGAILGTPSYMSPEQAQGKSRQITTATDVYSLGAILYQMLTGHPPFAEESSLATLKAVVEKVPINPNQFNPTLDLDLETICLKCLHKMPDQRYASAEALAEDMERWLNREPIAARPTTAYRRARMWVRRRPVVFSFASLFLMALMVCSGLGLIAIRQAQAAKTAVLRAEEQQRIAVQQRQEVENQRREVEKQRAKAEEALTWSFIQHGLKLLDLNESNQGLVYLAHVLNQNPTNRNVASRLYSALMHRTTCRQITPSLEHDQKVKELSFSPDTRYLFTRTEDDRIRVWDAQQGKLAMRIMPLVSKQATVMFSSDSRYIFQFNSAQTWECWEITTGTKLIGNGLNTNVSLFSWTFPTNRVVKRLDANTIIVLDASKDGKESLPIHHAGEILAYDFSPDGAKIVTASKDRTARIWDAETGKPMTSPMEQFGEVADVRFSRDGQWVLTGNFGWCASLWNTESGKRITDYLQHAGSVNKVCISPDGRRIATAWHGPLAGVRIYEVDNQMPLFTPLVHSNQVTWAEFSRDGQWLLTACADGSTRVWDFMHGLKQVGLTAQHEGRIVEARFSPKHYWFATGSKDGTAQVWSTTNGLPVSKPMRLEGPSTSLSFSPDGQWLATADSKGTVRVWNSLTGDAVTPPILHAASVNSVAFSPDGKWIVTACEDRSARVYEAATGTPVSPPVVHDDPITSAVFSPDNRKAVTATALGQMRVWDTGTGKTICQTGKDFLNPVGIGAYAEFSPTGTSVLGTCGFNASQVSATSARAVTSVNSGGRTTFAKFSPDGKWFVTTSTGKSAILWEAEEAQNISERLMHDTHVLRADFSPDSCFLVTVAKDNIARIWELCPGKPGESMAYLAPLTTALVRSSYRKGVRANAVSNDTCELMAEIKRQYPNSVAAQKIADWFMSTGTNRACTPLSPRFQSPTISPAPGK